MDGRSIWGIDGDYRKSVIPPVREQAPTLTFKVAKEEVKTMPLRFDDFMP